MPPYFNPLLLGQLRGRLGEEERGGRGPAAGPAAPVPAAAEQPERAAVLRGGEGAAAAGPRRAPGPGGRAHPLGQHHVPGEPPALGPPGGLPPRQAADRQAPGR